MDSGLVLTHNHPQASGPIVAACWLRVTYYTRLPVRNEH